MSRPSAEELCLNVFFPGELLLITGLMGETYFVVNSIAPVSDCRLAHHATKPPTAEQISLRLRISITKVREELIGTNSYFHITFDDGMGFALGDKHWLLISIYTNDNNTLELDMVRIMAV